MHCVIGLQTYITVSKSGTNNVTFVGLAVCAVGK